MDFDAFHQKVEKDCFKDDETIIRLEHGLSILNDIGFTSSSKLKDIKSFSEMSSHNIHLLYDEVFYFSPMENEGPDDFDQENARQTLMDLHRIAGLSNITRHVQRSGKKRRLL